MKIRAIVFAVFVASLATLGGCNGGSQSSYGSTPVTPPSTSAPPPNTITMSGMAFSPATITITKGTSLTWKNSDGTMHTSTSDTGVWNSGDIPAGQSKQTTFGTAGTFPFHCAYHGMMTGTVIVQ